MHTYTEAGDVAVVVTPDSQTEVGEEVKASGDTRSTQDTSSRGPYDTDKTFSSNSDRIIVSSSDDMLTFDSRISSSSLSGEGGGGGRGGEVMSEEVTRETGAAPAKETTAESKGTKQGPKGTEVPTTGDTSANQSTSERRNDGGVSTLPLSHTAPVAGDSKSHRSGTPVRSEIKGDNTSGRESVGRVSETQQLPTCVDERGRSANVTPTIVISEDELGDGEGGEGWWSERGSPVSAGARSEDSPFKTETATAPDGQGDTLWYSYTLCLC